MSQDLIAQLRSPDADTRKRAIIALGRSLDPRALPALKYAYENDPVPALRDLALKAGRHIRKHAPAQAPPPAAAPFIEDVGGYEAVPPAEEGYAGSESWRDENAPAPVYDAYSGTTIGGEASYGEAYEAGWEGPSLIPKDAVYGTGLSTHVNVSAADQERASQYQRQAFQHHFNGETDKAAQRLGRALEINPNLSTDQAVQNLAAEITRLTRAEAIAVLADPERRKAFTEKAQDKIRQRKGVAKGGAPTWGDVGLDIAILFMVSVVGAVVIGVLGQIADYGRIDSGYVTVVMFGGAAIGIYLAISVLANGGAAHFAAKLFGGIASITESYHALIPGQAVVMVGFYVWIALISFDPESMVVMCFGMFLLVVGSMWLLSTRLAAVHFFSAWSGCMSMVIGNIALTLILWVGFAITSAIGVSLFDAFFNSPFPGLLLPTL
ncbi:MAG: HEAT repeat domain-containing protein [Anaerolineae bacterium]|nr:HEAT repeat domain-containing protein [Anaerolineae bacterium]